MHPEHEEVLSFIRDPRKEAFSDLAVRVFHHQYAHIPALRNWCNRRGIDPQEIRSWRDIPAVPSVAFKYEVLCCGPPERVFVSSGTTRGTEQRSRHGLPDLRLYRESAVRGLKAFLFPDTEAMPILSLVPSATEWPQSSLAQMISWAVEAFGTPSSATFARDGELDFRGFQAALEESARSGEPVCIMTTTGTWIRFLDFCRALGWSVRLPHGSRLMDTGGSKGAPRPLSRNGLLHATWNTLAIPGYFVVNEYGMSELCSQYYDAVIAHRTAGVFAARSKRALPWLRTRVLDPQTLTDVAPGELGLLCHVDLANAGSVLAILTEDLGRLTPQGLEVVGRAAHADLRGCSLALADFIAG
ncbi:MAG: coenzyme F390 synthetase [Candidatus Binatia bacterium]|nr:MAG: coenzyme F390 synthetase [Candidatus Binatia bacterium]